MKNKITITAFIFIAAFIALIFIVPKYKTGSKNKSGSIVMIKLPYTFKSQKAEQMSVKAFDLKKEKKFDDAISLYGQAIKVEPDNPKLFFDLSECYMSIDKLEQAILLLDTAIMLDPFRSAFYNNRGLN